MSRFAYFGNPIALAGHDPSASTHVRSWVAGTYGTPAVEIRVASGTFGTGFSLTSHGARRMAAELMAAADALDAALDAERVEVAA